MAWPNFATMQLQLRVNYPSLLSPLHSSSSEIFSLDNCLFHLAAVPKAHLQRSLKQKVIWLLKCPQAGKLSAVIHRFSALKLFWYLPFSIFLFQHSRIPLLFFYICNVCGVFSFLSWQQLHLKKRTIEINRIKKDKRSKEQSLNID